MAVQNELILVILKIVSVRNLIEGRFVSLIVPVSCVKVVSVLAMYLFMAHFDMLMQRHAGCMFSTKRYSITLTKTLSAP